MTYPKFWNCITGALALLLLVALIVAPGVQAAPLAHWTFDEGLADNAPTQGAPEGVLLDLSPIGTAMDAGMLGGGLYRADVPAPFAGLSLELDGTDSRILASGRKHETGGG